MHLETATGQCVSDVSFKMVNCQKFGCVILFYPGLLLLKTFADRFDLSKWWPHWISGKCYGKKLDDISIIIGSM